LYVTNYSHTLGNFDTSIATSVLNSHSAAAATAIVNECVAGDWDGISIDIENVAPADRNVATAFILSVADQLHAIHKQCHVAVPAPTGTDYDWSDWVDWCDHVAIIKRVDYMHYMTYLESGTGGPPGPHAPTTFWNLVYSYAMRTIPARFRKRILVGCNVYGDIWDADLNSSYSSYWTALAEGLMRGTIINTDNAESNWNAYGYQAYFATPDTMQRAVNESLIRGFGGIGAWKADDGDRFSFFPQHPQIGRKR
jgi:spore germination protein YaaH